MIILTDCLTKKVDEGSVCVANNIVRRIKRMYADTTVVSFKNQNALTDIYIKLNKLFLNQNLCKIIREKKNSLLYIPFASNSTAAIIRLCILSVYTNGNLVVLFVLRHPMNHLAKKLLKISKSKIIVLSKESFKFFLENTDNTVYYLKTGIDVKKFVPVSLEQKKILRAKYGISLEKKVVLHVGHLKYGRNIDKIVHIDSEYQVVVIVSSLTKDERDLELKRKLENRENIIIIDKYLGNIQELYQLSDVYFFPVCEEENCIDVPLSVLEAAACNIPIVTTSYGEIKSFYGRRGFWFIDRFDSETINNALNNACNEKNADVRQSILEYDWDISMEYMKKIIE